MMTQICLSECASCSDLDPSKVEKIGLINLSLLLDYYMYIFDEIINTKV